MAIGVGVKSALLPVHAWLPDAHASAPHPVSAMLSGVMLKVSFLATVRLLALAGEMRIERLLLWVGAVTALVAVVYALAQTDAKRLLAYHSVSQMGYIAAAWGAATAASRTAALYHLASHALFKSLLFLVIGALIEATGQRRIGSIRTSRKTAWRLAPPYLVGALAITGMPPLNGHISKALVSAALKGEPAYFLVLAAGFGTVASFLKLASVFVTTGGDAGGAQRPVPRATTAAIAGLSLLCLATGIAPGFWASRLADLGADLGAGVAAAAYTLEALRSSVITLAAGAALYALVRSRAGQRVLHRIRGLEPGLNGALALVLAGFVGLGVAVSLAVGIPAP